MKAIKIDVEKREVYSVEIITQNGSELHSIHDLLGCDCFCSALAIGKSDLLYVDDNGLFRTPQQVNGAFLITGQSNPLIGHGLVAGHDSEGESQDVTVTVEQLKPHITWLSVEDVRDYLLT